MIRVCILTWGTDARGSLREVRELLATASRSAPNTSRARPYSTRIVLA